MVVLTQLCTTRDRANTTLYMQHMVALTQLTFTTHDSAIATTHNLHMFALKQLCTKHCCANNILYITHGRAYTTLHNTR